MTKAKLHELVDELPDAALDGAAVLLRGIIDGPIDPSQAWFWTPQWQAGERQADDQLAASEGIVHRSTEDFIAHLDAVAPEDAGWRCRRTRSCRFLRDWGALRAEQRIAFLAALRLFVTGVVAQQFDPRLRVKRVQGYPNVWEMTWAPDRLARHLPRSLTGADRVQAML
jgi:hypothetical protein